MIMKMTCTDQTIWRLHNRSIPDAKLNAQQITVTQEMMSSCTGALLTSLTMTPFDVVKVRLQVQQKNLMKSKCFMYCNEILDLCTCLNDTSNQLHFYKRPSYFNNTADAFIKIAKYEGMSSLWSGLSPTLIMVIPSTVIYFGTYEHLKRTFFKFHKSKFQHTLINSKMIEALIPMVAGSTARTVAATLFCPLEMVRTKLQSQKMTHLEVIRALKLLTKNDGFLSLWKGLVPTLFRDVPFSAIYWGTYEYMKRTFSAGKSTFSFSFLAGASSGTIAAMLTLPFDVVKTHRQIELGDSLINKEAGATRSPIKNIFYNIYSQHGLRGFYTGITPRIIKVAPACAIMISTYEVIKNLMVEKNLEKIKYNSY